MDRYKPVVTEIKQMGTVGKDGKIELYDMGCAG